MYQTTPYIVIITYKESSFINLIFIRRTHQANILANINPRASTLTTKHESSAAATTFVRVFKKATVHWR